VDRGKEEYSCCKLLRQSMLLTPDFKTLHKMPSWKSLTFQDRPVSVFKYEPLKDLQDIRIVLIQPNSTQSAQIVCTLVTTKLTSPTYAYQCLSYVWGNPTQSKNIVCNNSTVKVTENLYTAMKNIRQKSDTLAIWIDQLCINQVDLSERSQQVLLMAEIYRKAQKTIIWLGKSADNSDLAMKVVQKSKKFTTTEYKDLVESGVIDFTNLPTKLGLPNWNDRSWVALRLLLKRPWFKRTWVSIFPNSINPLD
jgi:Heterokaryon incompatibility protein (HET)